MQAEQEDNEETISLSTPMPMPAPQPVPAPANAKHADTVHAHVCKDCHVLPIGSVELVGLLLVLVFALSAVLLTSIYVIETRM